MKHPALCSLMIIQIMAIMLLTSEAKAGNSYSLLPSWPNEIPLLPDLLKS